MTATDPQAAAGQPRDAGDRRASESDRLLVERVRRQHELREKARREPVGSLWRTVAHVGTLGWLIALPPVACAFLGHLLDMRLGTGIAMALGLMLVGLSIGGYFYWRAIQETSDQVERASRGGQP